MITNNTIKRLPGIREKIRQPRVFNSCYTQDWCTCGPNDIGKTAICASLAVYDFNKSIQSTLWNYQTIGNEKMVVQLSYLANKLNGIINYLMLVSAQRLLNNEEEDSYVDCNFIDCIIKEFACVGLDIRCIIECFNICGYGKTCKKCS